MNVTNFEIKVKVDNLLSYEEKLLTLKPKFHGIDYQKDTYYNATKGMLKLREGNIENGLVFYYKESKDIVKKTETIIYQHEPNEALKQILVNQLGIKNIVEKQRKMYFIENVKFNFDIVKGLGNFIEIEAIAHEDNFSNSELEKQCYKYFNFLNFEESFLVNKTYSDLIEYK